MLNKSVFFSTLRGTLFVDRLSRKQAEGLEVLLNYWQQKAPTLSTEEVAYVLATAYHETARTMQPIEEYGRGKNHPYGVVDAETGVAYYGRGYVQLTWKTNYASQSKRLGLDLVRKPHIAMQPDVAADILYHGMIHGSFTKKKMSDYIEPEASPNGRFLNWKAARRVVNGTDKDALIARHAEHFYEALTQAISMKDQPDDAVKPDGKTAMESTTVWAQIGAMVSSVIVPLTGALSGMDWKVVLAFGAIAAAGFGLYTIRERLLKIDKYGV